MNTGVKTLMALVVAAGLAACDTTAAEGPATTEPEATSPSPRDQFLEDVGLRDVRMASGRALRYVQRETASQVLCQLLEKDAWKELLDGRVGRRASKGPEAACQIFFEQGLVTVQMRPRDEGLAADTTIAGRPALAENDKGYTVALTDEALEPTTRQYSTELRLLTVEVTHDKSSAAPALVEKVLEEVVPLITEEGDPVPDIDDRGYLRYEKTPLTGDFVDQPVPVQALQLCTLVREELDLRVRGVEVRETGDCRVDAEDNFTIGTEPANAADSYTDRVAGRPATNSDTGSTRVLLRDDAGTHLRVTGESAIEIAEKLVPLLTK